MELRQGGFSADWFFLAVAQWQLGEKEQARKRVHQAVLWMDKNQPQDAELRCFRAEAAALLGLQNAPPPPNKESRPPRSRLAPGQPLGSRQPRKRHKPAAGMSPSVTCFGQKHQGE